MITVNLWNGETGEVTSEVGQIGWDCFGIFIRLAGSTPSGFRLMGETLIQTQRIRCCEINRQHPHLVNLGTKDVSITRSAWEMDIVPSIRRFEANVARGAEALPPYWDRIPAARQRELFGGVPFGKRKVLHRPELRGLDVQRVVAFGQDVDVQHWTYQEIASLVEAGESVVGKRD